ncbi:hypothetical protein EVA_21819, partial [gut metagenome]
VTFATPGKKGSGILKIVYINNILFIYTIFRAFFHPFSPEVERYKRDNVTM